MKKYRKEDVRFDIRPDAQAFDEIRIITVPRYKTSYLSGDEWRISANVQLFRKGKLVHECGAYSNVESACKYLSMLYDKTICEKGANCSGGGGVEQLCDQEGCNEKATVFYRKKENVCERCASKKEAKCLNLGKQDGIVVRKFCERHKRRGDGGLDDADKNYEEIILE